MTCSNKPQIDTDLNNIISNFLEQYGTRGLKQALHLYKKTLSTVTNDISYISFFSLHKT